MPRARGFSTRDRTPSCPTVGPNAATRSGRTHCGRRASVPRARGFSTRDRAPSVSDGRAERRHPERKDTLRSSRLGAQSARLLRAGPDTVGVRPPGRTPPPERKDASRPDTSRPGRRRRRNAGATGRRRAAHRAGRRRRGRDAGPRHRRKAPPSPGRHGRGPARGRSHVPSGAFALLPARRAPTTALGPPRLQGRVRPRRGGPLRPAPVCRRRVDVSRPVQREQRPRVGA